MKNLKKVNVVYMKQNKLNVEIVIKIVRRILKPVLRYVLDRYFSVSAKRATSETPLINAFDHLIVR